MYALDQEAPVLDRPVFTKKTTKTVIVSKPRAEVYKPRKRVRTKRKGARVSLPLQPESKPVVPAAIPWELLTPQGRRAQAGIWGYRSLIARALEILGFDEIPDFPNDAEYATILITLINPRHAWRLFDSTSPKELAEAREFICTIGEIAVTIIKEQAQ